VTLPRLVVAAPASGHGKTTVATGLMAALRAAGHTVSGHKVGPDFVDSRHHGLATGRPGRNLDPHLTSPELLAPLLAHGARGADLAVIEGVMGLYDGMLGTDGFASTAAVAAAVGAPVVLVVDVSHTARTVGAIVHGMVGYGAHDPAGAVRVAGVIINKAASERHTAEIRAALEPTGVPVLGVLGRDVDYPVLTDPATTSGQRGALGRLAALIAEQVDLAALVRIAGGAPDLACAPWDPAALAPAPAVAGFGPVVAVADGPGFSSRYAETLEVLTASGLTPALFDPRTAPALPSDTAAVVIGGDLTPELAAEVGANTALAAQLRRAVDAGIPVLAEGSAALWLGARVDDTAMSAAVPIHGSVAAPRTLGYRIAIAPAAGLGAAAGARATGHEYHRARLENTDADPAWLLRPAGPVGAATPRPDGLRTATVHAGLLHTHPAGATELWSGLIAAAHRATPLPAPAAPASAASAAPRSVPAAAPDPAPAHEPDLHHHGDRELAPGLTDLAVNVSTAARPDWLQQALADSLSALEAYPDPSAARAALAARHGRAPEAVLPTAGGAEAFTLLARAREWRRAVVVHPQFTEPEAALRAAGHEVTRVVLRAEDGFRLDAGAVPEGADLVVVGNPTNPTSVLHPAGALTALARPGRTLVVDEAFIDALDGEPESLAAADLPGAVVLRSLTKTWAIPGLRAGYAVGDPAVIADMAAVQPPWSVSTPAAAAMIACASPEALAEQQRRAHTLAAHRAELVAALSARGITPVGPARAPFVLVRCPEGTRAALRDRGFAVRRGDTFPGLATGPDGEWVRIAVRAPEVTAALLAAWPDGPA